MARIEARVGEPDFWKDQAEAGKLLQRRRRIEEDITLRDGLRQRGDDLAVLVEWMAQGEAVDDEFARGLDDLTKDVETGEVKKMLGGEHDRRNAIITVHPGAGGKPASRARRSP
jgi:peptide chain release factor 2